MAENVDGLLEALLDAWERNSQILINLLLALPHDVMRAYGAADSPSVAQLFAHMHYVRLAVLHGVKSDCAIGLPADQWAVEHDRDRIATWLRESATAVHEAVREWTLTQRPSQLPYDHPILILQHLIWHEGYHHGQIKLVLKLYGQPLTDDEAGPVTWDLWMRRLANSRQGRS